MKLKKVVSLCLSSGRVQLFDHVDNDGVVGQWLGDGCAIYPLGNIPYLDEDTACAVFDITEKKRLKMMVSKDGMPDRISVNDYDAGDRQAEDMGISVNYHGTNVQPLLVRPGNEIIYIQKKYLAPLDDVMDDLQFCVREMPGGERYVVAFVGLLIAAVIMPYEPLGEDYVKKLEDIARMTTAEIERRKRLGVTLERRAGDEEAGDDGEA